MGAFEWMVQSLAAAAEQPGTATAQQLSEAADAACASEHPALVWLGERLAQYLRDGSTVDDDPGSYRRPVCSCRHQRDESLRQLAAGLSGPISARAHQIKAMAAAGAPAVRVLHERHGKLPLSHAQLHRILREG